MAQILFLEQPLHYISGIPVMTSIIMIIVVEIIVIIVTTTINILPTYATRI